ncbi:MAG: cupredoxin domain-containing protein [Thermoplasmata archaeon]
MIEILAYREEAGGWTLDKIELSKGETYTIKLLAIDVSHGFEVDGFNISVVLIPGHPQEVTITPMETGSFEFRCTIYCSELHSSMRGTIVVA